MSSSTAISPSGGLPTHEVGDSSSGGRTAMSASVDRHIRIEGQNRGVNEIELNQLEQGNQPLILLLLLLDHFIERMSSSTAISFRIEEQNRGVNEIEVNQLEQENLINAQQPPQPEQVPIIPDGIIINPEKHRVERRDEAQTEDEHTTTTSNPTQVPPQAPPQVPTEQTPEGSQESLDLEGGQGTTEGRITVGGGGLGPPGGEPVSIFILNPDGWWYQLWSYLIVALSVWSSFFMPLEFAFCADFPEGSLSIIDLAVGVFFFVDILMQFCMSYEDDTGLMVNRNKPIAIRCLRSYVIYFEILAWCPWSFLYMGCGRNEVVRWCLWFRVYRAFKVKNFFQNIGMNYRFIRILKSFTILLYYIHTGGCFFYYLATAAPHHLEKSTWIGLMLGDFRQTSFGLRYVLSLYFAVITVSTVGYGDLHAGTVIEMIFTIIYVLFSMILVPYVSNFALQDM